MGILAEWRIANSRHRRKEHPIAKLDMSNRYAHKLGTYLYWVIFVQNRTALCAVKRDFVAPLATH
jgi:hypothetical protein